MPPAGTSVPTVSGAVPAILAQQDPSPTSRRPLWRQPPSTVSERCKFRSGGGCSTSEYARHTAARTLATSAPMAVTTPRCSPMDSMRTGHREGPHAVSRHFKWVPDGVRQRMPISRTLVDRYHLQESVSARINDDGEASLHLPMSRTQTRAARASQRSARRATEVGPDWPLARERSWCALSVAIRSHTAARAQSWPELAADMPTLGAKSTRPRAAMAAETLQRCKGGRTFFGQVSNVSSHPCNC